MLLLHLASYAAAVIAFIFCTLSLASGLLYIAEVIEEHTKLAKLIGQRLIFGIVAFHLALYWFDHLPLHLVALGIVCHATYYTNLAASTWPFISLTSINFLASCCLVLLDHFAWFFYFAERAKNVEEGLASRYRNGRTPYRPAWDAGVARSQADEPLSFMDVATFFGICVWLVPFFLFLSLSANDNVLPSQAIAVPATPSLGKTNSPQLSINPSGAVRVLPRASILKSLLINPLLSLVPRLNRNEGRSSRSQREGLIASPRIHASSQSGEFSPKFGSFPFPNGGPPSPSPGSPLTSRMNGNQQYDSAPLGFGRPPPKRSQTMAAGMGTPPHNSAPFPEIKNEYLRASSGPGGADNSPSRVLRRVASGTSAGLGNGHLGSHSEDSTTGQSSSRGPSRAGSPAGNRSASASVRKYD